MPYFNGIEICQPEYNGPESTWDRDISVSRRMKVRGAGGEGEVTQFMGRGNWRVQIEATLTRDAYAALYPLEGNGYAYPLTDLFGVDFPAVYLTQITNVRINKDGSIRLATLEFER